MILSGSFFRAAIPQDLTAGSPTPSIWGAPSAILSPSRCNITEHFRNHVIIFDITFCGDLAGNNYANSQCPGTCPERIQDPANFIVRGVFSSAVLCIFEYTTNVIDTQNSTWHINSLKVYQKLEIFATIDSGNGAGSTLMKSWGSYSVFIGILASLLAFAF